MMSSIPPFVFGCWQLGGEYWGNVDISEIQRAIEIAWERGVRCFDTAPLYGHGLADQRLVETLGTRKHEALIATKVGVRMVDGHAQSDLSEKYIEQDIQNSLRRLGLDSIPLLQVHWPCEQGTSLEESFSCLAKFREKGLIQRLGVCNYQVRDLKQILSITNIDSIQTPYSLLRREFENELQPLCLMEKIPVLAYEGLCRGLLSGKYKTPPNFPDTDQRSWDERFQGAWFWHNRALVDSLEKVGQKTGEKVSTIALAWLLSQQGIQSIIAGIKSEKQLKENLRALRLSQRTKICAIVSKIANLHGGYIR